MSSNQHPGHQDLSNETSNSQSRGGRVSNNGQPVSDASIVNSNQYVLFDSHWRRGFTNVESSNLNQGSIPVAHGSDYQDSNIQDSNTHAPTTRQPPTLPSIAATSGVPLHPGSFNLGPPYSWNNENTSAPRSWAQVRIGGDLWMPGSTNNALVPLNWLQLLSTHLGYNPNYPWNENNSPAPLHPHPVVSATGHPAAAGYHPSTFPSSPVSARNQELMDGSTPLETSGRQSWTPNPLGAVGDYHRALSRYHITRFETFTARRQLRISNAQTGDALPIMNEESDSVGIETPSSDDEAELYDCSVNGDGPGVENEGEEQDTGAYEEVVESEERLTNGLNAEG